MSDLVAWRSARTPEAGTGAAACGARLVRRNGLSARRAVAESSLLRMEKTEVSFALDKREVAMQARMEQEMMRLKNMLSACGRGCVGRC